MKNNRSFCHSRDYSSWRGRISRSPGVLVKFTSKSFPYPHFFKAHRTLTHEALFYPRARRYIELAVSALYIYIYTYIHIYSVLAGFFDERRKDRTVRRTSGPFQNWLLPCTSRSRRVRDKDINIVLNERYAPTVRRSGAIRNKTNSLRRAEKVCAEYVSGDRQIPTSSSSR